MSALFTGESIPRSRRELAPGAVHLPGHVDSYRQRWLVDRFHEWRQGPVPLHSAKVRGHEMSVRTVCLGWHWRPYEYSRTALDVNGRRVLDFPAWMVRLGRSALAAAASEYLPGPDEYEPDTALINYYDADARMGMHQDRDERSLAPVVSVSIGDTCRFRFGNTENRNRPYEDIELMSGDVLVFGGPSRLAYHGVPKVLSDTAPEECGLTTGRINITMRVTGFEKETTNVGPRRR